MKNNKLIILLFVLLFVSCKSLDGRNTNSFLLVEFFSDKNLKVESKEVLNFKFNLNDKQLNSIDTKNYLYQINQNTRKKVVLDYIINGETLRVNYDYISKKLDSKYVYCKVYFNSNNKNLKKIIRKGDLIYKIGEDSNCSVIEFTAMPNIVVDGKLNTFNNRFNAIINNIGIGNLPN
ncbi:hypothetical protein [Flavobacterium sp.]|uniref:hypothetical protein n=1 Tax=Flavobacterium sp. TaxID=239 RepID=UPI0025BDBDCD|nr:hypothetical protein [Flavobacterium sp.]